MQQQQSDATPLAPIFEQLPVGGQFVEGGDAVFECRVRGNPAPEVLWSRRGLPMHSDERHHIWYDKSTGQCQLAISKLTIDDDGDYTCTATNRAGEASLTVIIERQRTQPIAPSTIEQSSSLSGNDYLTTSKAALQTASQYPNQNNSNNNNNNNNLVTPTKNDPNNTAHNLLADPELQQCLAQHSLTAQDLYSQNYYSPVEPSIGLGETSPSTAAAPTSYSELRQHEYLSEKPASSSNYSSSAPMMDHHQFLAPPDATTINNNNFGANIGIFEKAITHDAVLRNTSTVDRDTREWDRTRQRGVAPQIVHGPSGNVRLIEDSGEPLRLSALIRAYPEPRCTWFRDGTRVAGTTHATSVRRATDITTAAQATGVSEDPRVSVGLVSCATSLSHPLSKPLNKDNEHDTPGMNMDNSDTDHATEWEAWLELKRPRPTDSGHYTLLVDNELGARARTQRVQIDAHRVYTPEVVPYGGGGDDQGAISETKNRTSEWEQRRRMRAESHDTTTTTDAYETDADEVQLGIGRGVGLIADTSVPTGATRHLLEGQMVRFDCRVAGRPTPEVTWYHQRRRVHDDATHKLMVNERGVHSLMITSVALSDQGEWLCVARNPNGASKFIVQVQVQARAQCQAPRFTRTLSTCHVDSGATDVRLECCATGVPTPQLTWQRDGVEWAPRDTQRVHVRCDPLTGNASIHFERVEPNDGAWYECTARNQAGVATTRARLYVRPRAPAPHTDGTQYVIQTPAKWRHLKPPAEPVREKVRLRHVERRLTTIPTTENGSGPLWSTHSTSSSASLSDNVQARQQQQQQNQKPTAAATPHRQQQSSPSDAWLVQLKDVQVHEGDRCTLEAVLTPTALMHAGEHRLVRWLKDGQQPLVDDSRRFTRESSDGHLTLTLVHASAHDAGLYTCQLLRRQLRHASDLHATSGIAEAAPTSNTTTQFQQADELVCVTQARLSVITKRLATDKAAMSSQPQPDEAVPNQPEHDGDKYMRWQQRHLDDSEYYDREHSVRETREVRRKPSFVRPLPDSQRVAAGTTVRLLCALDVASLNGAENELRIDWFRNGEPLQAEPRLASRYDGSSGEIELTLAQCNPQDTGLYTCQAATSAGVSLTNGQLLIVEQPPPVPPKPVVVPPPPTVMVLEHFDTEPHVRGRSNAPSANEQPTSDTDTSSRHHVAHNRLMPRFVHPLRDLGRVDEGTKQVKFEANIEPQSDAQLRIEWLKDGAPIGASTRVTAFAEFGYVSLTINGVDERDTGLYTCVVSNRVGVARSSARLDVTPGATIVKQSLLLPLDDNNTNDNNNVFGGGNGGGGPHSMPSDRWLSLERKHNNNRQNSDRRTPPDVEPVKPCFLYGLRGKNVLVEGERAHFETQLEQWRDESLRCEWLLNGRPLPVGSWYRTYFDFGHVALDITHTYAALSGHYTCRVSNARTGEADETSLMVAIVPASTTSATEAEESECEMVTQQQQQQQQRETEREATFIKPLEDVEAFAGGSAHLEAQMAPPTLFQSAQWYHDGRPLDTKAPVDKERITTAYSFGFVSLTINYLTIEDAGRYTVRVFTSTTAPTAPASNVIESSAYLRIQRPEIVETQLPRVQLKHSPDGYTTRPRFVKCLPERVDTVEGRTVALEARLAPFDQFGPVPTADGRSVDPASEHQLHVEWLKDGRPLDASSRLSAGHEFDVCTLRVLKCDERDSGLYTCRAYIGATPTDTNSAVTQTHVRVRSTRSIISESPFSAPSAVYEPEVWSSETETQHFGGHRQYERPQPSTDEQQRPMTNGTAAIRMAPLQVHPAQALEGQRVHFETRVAEAKGSDPPEMELDVEWRHNGVPVQAGHRFRPLCDFGYVALDILYAYPEDSGHYECVVRDAAQQRQTELARASTQLSVRARNAVDTGTCNELALPHIERLEASAADVCGLEQQCATQSVPQFVEPLTVSSGTQAPLVSSSAEQPVCLQVPEGQPVHFECRLMPIPSTTDVEWWHNGAPVQCGHRFRSTNDFGYVALDILYVYPEDSGLYECMVLADPSSGYDSFTSGSARNHMSNGAPHKANNVCARQGAKLTVMQRASVNMDSIMRSTSFQLSSSSTLSTQRSPMIAGSGSANDDDDDGRQLGSEQQQVMRFVVPLTVQGQRQAVQLREGQSVHLETRLEPTNDAYISVEWLRDGEPLIAGSRFRTCHEFGYVSLDILHAYAEDSGNYVARATRALKPYSARDENAVSDNAFINSPAGNGYNQPASGQQTNASTTEERPEQLDSNSVEIRVIARHSVEYAPTQPVGEVAGGDKWQQSASDIAADPHNLAQYGRRSSDGASGADVEGPPRFVAALDNLSGVQQLREGQAAYFECRLAPTPRASEVEWLHNGVPVQAGHRFRTTNDFGYVALDILYVYPEDSGHYECVARNKWGATRTGCRVGVIGRNPVSYESQFEAQRLADLEHGTNGIAKCTNSNNHDNDDNDGEFFHYFDAGQVAPKFTVPLRGTRHVYEGQSAHLECRLEPWSDSQLRVEFLRDGAPLEVGSRFRPHAEFGYVTLDIGAMAPKDAGVYSVRATNAHGSVTTSLRIDVSASGDVQTEPIHTRSLALIQENFEQPHHNVNADDGAERTPIAAEAPYFVRPIEPQRVECNEGATIEFEARVAPAPDAHLKLEWLRDGEPLPVGTRIYVDADSVYQGVAYLRLEHTAPEDAGTYTCLARNQHGECTSSPALVQVHARAPVQSDSLVTPASLEHIRRLEEGRPPREEWRAPPIEQAPKFLTHLNEYQELNEGDAVHFECRLAPVGDPTLKTEWYFNGRPLQTGSRVHTIDADFGYCVLDIDYLYARDTGEYICRAVNAYGTDITQCVIKVKAAPTVVLDSQLATPISADRLRALENPDVGDGEPDEAPVITPARFVATLQREPASGQLIEGERAHLETRVSPATDNELQVQWLHNGSPVQAGHRFRPVFDFGYVALDILYVYPEDSGQYECVASNQYGSDKCVTSLQVEAKPSLVFASQLPPEMATGVEKLAAMEAAWDAAATDDADEDPNSGPSEKPEFVLAPSEAQAFEGSSARFSCRLSGRPRPRVQWRVNGATVVSGSRYRLIYDGMHHMEIRRCRLEDAGRVDVYARNVAGDCYAVTQLTVKRKLDDYRNVLKNSPRPWYDEQVRVYQRRRSLLTAGASEDDADQCEALVRTLAQNRVNQQGTVAFDNRQQQQGQAQDAGQQQKLRLECGWAQASADTINSYMEALCTPDVRLLAATPSYTTTPLDLSGVELHPLVSRAPIVMAPAPSTVKRALQESGQHPQQQQQRQLQPQQKSIPSVTSKTTPVSSQQSQQQTTPASTQVQAQPQPQTHPQWSNKPTSELTSATAQKVSTTNLVTAKPNETATKKDQRVTFKEPSGKENQPQQHPQQSANNLQIQTHNEQQQLILGRQSPESVVHGKEIHSHVHKQTQRERRAGAEITRTITEKETFQQEHRGVTQETIVSASVSDSVGGKHSAAPVGHASTQVLPAGAFPPEFIKKIAPCRAREGDSATFECAFSGEPRPTITWWRNGDTPIKQSNLYSVVTTSNKSTLCVRRVTRADSNFVFSVRADNACGSAKSSANLVIDIVDDATQFSKSGAQSVSSTKNQQDGNIVAAVSGSVPTFVHTIHDLIGVRPGELVRFDARIAAFPAAQHSTNKPIEVRWFKDGQRVRPDANHKLVLDGDTHTLLILETSARDSGQYECVASNEWGESRCSATLSMQRTSTTNTQSGDRTSSEHRPKEPAAVAAPDAATTTITTIGPGTDTIVSSSGSQSTNDDNAAMNIKVPKLIKRLVDQRVHEGQPVTFRCQISSFPIVNVHWFKGDTLIKPSKYFRIWKDNDETYCLRIVEAFAEDQGIYKCAVRAPNSKQLIVLTAAKLSVSSSSDSS
ncbi:Titin [Fragariocoptes setiger]|uniref:Titin n=1 Tax=Fragariocoptes setiger TaxID=1670756 RepID=A0ABQ7SDG6_9ACAR|nr:Titin [Fragariocoptes setiger]